MYSQVPEIKEWLSLAFMIQHIIPITKCILGPRKKFWHGVSAPQMHVE